MDAGFRLIHTAGLLSNNDLATHYNGLLATV